MDVFTFNLTKRQRRKTNFRRALLGSEEGKAVLTELFKVCVLDNINIPTEEAALHSQGRRWVYAYIVEIMNMNDAEMRKLAVTAQEEEIL